MADYGRSEDYGTSEGYGRNERSERDPVTGTIRFPRYDYKCRMVMEKELEERMAGEEREKENLEIGVAVSELELARVPCNDAFAVLQFPTICREGQGCRQRDCHRVRRTRPRPASAEMSAWVPPRIPYHPSFPLFISTSPQHV